MARARAAATGWACPPRMAKGMLLMLLTTSCVQSSCAFELSLSATWSVQTVLRRGARGRDAASRSTLGATGATAGDATDDTVVIGHRKDTVRNPPNRPVGSLDAVLDIELAHGRLQAKGVQHPFPVVGMDRLYLVGIAAADRLARSTPNSVVGGAQIQEAMCVHLGHPEHFVDVRGQISQPGLALT